MGFSSRYLRIPRPEVSVCLIRHPTELTKSVFSLRDEPGDGCLSDHLVALVK